MESRAHPTKTRAMISDPKLPFAGEPTRVGSAEELPLTRRSASPSQHSRITSDGPMQSRRSALRLCLHRVGVRLFVFLCATLGVMLMILPWRPEWTDNPILMMHPSLHDALSSGFVRGLVTGARLRAADRTGAADRTPGRPAIGAGDRDRAFPAAGLAYARRDGTDRSGGVDHLHGTGPPLGRRRGRT